MATFSTVLVQIVSSSLLGSCTSSRGADVIESALESIESEFRVFFLLLTFGKNVVPMGVAVIGSQNTKYIVFNGLFPSKTKKRIFEDMSSLCRSPGGRTCPERTPYIDLWVKMDFSHPLLEIKEKRTDSGIFKGL